MHSNNDFRAVNTSKLDGKEIILPGIYSSQIWNVSDRLLYKKLFDSDWNTNPVHIYRHFFQKKKFPDFDNKFFMS